MIAYFLVHRFPEQFKRMFQAIYAPGNIYLIHIDRNSGKALAQELEASWRLIKASRSSRRAGSCGAATALSRRNCGE